MPCTGLALPGGSVLPPGTIVGVNSRVVHYKKEIFGAEPEEFKPERWLRGQGEAEVGYEGG